MSETERPITSSDIEYALGWLPPGPGQYVPSIGGIAGPVFLDGGSFSVVNGNTIVVSGLVNGGITPPTVYTTSAVLPVTVGCAIANSTSPIAFTLNSGTTNGLPIEIKRYGSGSVSVTARIDGGTTTIVLNSAAIKESLTLIWSSVLNTWILT